MVEALMLHPKFRRNAVDQDKDGHPWNLVLWNIACYQRVKGDQKSYNGLYQQAIKKTCKNKANLSMMTYALSMSAERLLWCRQHGDMELITAQTDFMNTCRELNSLDLTEEMKRLFEFLKVIQFKNISDIEFEKIISIMLI